MRCQRCLQISFASIRCREYMQQPSFPELKRSAEVGCDLCGLSYAALISHCSRDITKFEDKDVKVIDMLSQGRNPLRADTSDTRVYIEGGDVVDYHECDKYKEKAEKVVVRVGDGFSGESSVEAYLKLGVDPDSVVTRYIAGRVPSQHPGDSSTMSRIKGWIQSCDETHNNCAYLSVDRPQPKRILDITKTWPVVRDTNFVEGRYVALSYCWGPSGKNILLTHKTFEDFTSTGIDPSTLPRTIQDAIDVCKTLGIYRLWIDALCIIQREPDLKDFIAEAPKMAEYYRNAYLTLIAGSAKDCTEGFLNERDARKAAPCELLYDRKDFPSDTDMTGVVKLFMTSSPFSGPIRDRAWTFQESELTQRSLTYGDELVHFKCPTRDSLEDGEFQNIYGPDQPQSSNPAGYPSIHHLVGQHGKPEILNRAYQMWFLNVLFSYTSRDMSDKQDKFAAIAGFANLFQTVVQCRYIYGLWEDAIPQGLLWITLDPQRPRRGRRPITRAVNRAPSWSWASLDGPILHRFASHRQREEFRDPKVFRLEILSYDNVSFSFDPIREAPDAPAAFELAVRGLLRRVWYAPRPSGKLSKFLLCDTQHVCDADKTSVELQDAQIQQSSTREHLAIGGWDATEDYEKGTFYDRQLHALLLWRKVGLLLVHVDGKRYRRIGNFEDSKQQMFEKTGPEDLILI